MWKTNYTNKNVIEFKIDIWILKKLNCLTNFALNYGKLHTCAHVDRKVLVLILLSLSILRAGTTKQLKRTVTITVLVSYHW